MTATLTFSEAMRAIKSGWSEPEIFFYFDDVAALDYKDVTWNYRQAVDGYRRVVVGLHSQAQIAGDLFNDCVGRPIDIMVCREHLPIVNSSRNKVVAEEAKGLKEFQAARDRFEREFPKSDFMTISAYDIGQADRLNTQAQRYGQTPAFLNQARALLQEALRAKEAVALQKTVTSIQKTGRK